ncbi:ribbon-helix-helix protein, CopG family [Candidatus Woesearchaeota archaeon]|nr:ribbon-helix-helix protein, CopG family [Candidatus Woesearchaeota archaeon]
MFKKISISVPEDMYDQIRRHARRCDLKISSIFRQGAIQILKRENATIK